MIPHPKSLTRRLFGVIVLVSVVGAAAGVLWAVSAPDPSEPEVRRVARPVSLQRLAPDPFDGGAAWLNTGGPIRLKDLRGKIVLLDFWTYCCINCHHVLPDLARLEEKYKDQLVVIGVHTPKFTAERDTENVRRKVREYGIKHPVVCDSDQVIWNRFGVNSWPTLVLIGPDGSPVGSVSGEGHYAVLDRAIGALVAEARAKELLNETPVKFFPENEKPDNTPLLFPGKVLADAEGKRLFVSDTGHNRLVMTDLEGKSPVPIGNGTAGLVDGAFDKAEFQRPQGMTLVGETLYVADTENHAIRAVDLKARTVTTVAGTGRQAPGITQSHALLPARKVALSSPWDLTQVKNGRGLYVAMAGPHQIWRFDPESGQIGLWAGTGVENIIDGPAASAAFAQPSGLATDGEHLFVADSEVSAVRSIALNDRRHPVRSVVGEGLFEFGDLDGRGSAVRLQHCLGLAYGGGKLYVADTYNNKIKVCDPAARTVKSLVGSHDPGGGDKPPQFYQPGGLSLAGTKLYVADTNNHKVRVIDLDTETVSTLDTPGLTPPAGRPRPPAFPNAVALAAKAVEIAPGKEFTLDVTLPIPPGFKLNEEGSMPYLVQTPGKKGLIDFPEAGERLDSPRKQLSVKVKLDEGVKDGTKFNLKLSVAAFVCSQGSNLCMIKSFVWNVPVAVSDQGSDKVSVETQGQ